MSEHLSDQGSCLCGSVKIKTESMDTNYGVCHCNMCRKWSGGPLFAVDCGTKVEFQGEENIGVYNSSDWAERGFCKNCGSGLFYRIKQTGQCLLPVGLMEKQGDLGFDHEVFVDEQLKSYSFKNETKRMTGAEVFAMFSGES